MSFRWSTEERKMIPHNTLKAIRTHKNVRSLRSLMTKVGPARGNWLRVRESEDLARRARPSTAVKTASSVRPRHH
jgi:hypothetical protein